MLETGSLLDGKYKILNIIGRGGMSVVYLAINERANKTWAVKEVRKDGGSGAGIVTQGLIAETEMLKRLNHPNLPSIVDVIDGEESFIIVMDYIEGTSLLDLLQQKGAQPTEKVLEWAHQLCDVLGYLHSRRPPIIYRDMKPSNVMLRPGGQLALIDFGTAREYKYSGEEDTMLLGTRGYAAPEQFGNMGQTDGRTDIYALGATMFHLLTGLSPASTHYEIPPVGNLLPELRGSGIEKVILKCCRPDPKERFQSCGELMYALEHIHDEDDKVIRSRKWKWRAFLACLLCTITAAAAGLGFRSAYHGTQEEIYKKHMQDAFTANSFAATAGACREAMDILPSEEEAWEKMIDALEELPVITDADYNAAIQCIMDTGDNQNGENMDHLQTLRRTRPNLYADFNYRMGMALFFNRQSGGEAESREFFRNAIQSETLDSTAREAASTMLTLADQYTKLNEMEAGELSGKNTHIRTFEVESGYRECWQTMETLTEDLQALETETGDIGYPIAVCERIAEELRGGNMVRYAGDGVTEASMRNTLKKIQKYMQEIGDAGQTENTQKRIQEVREKIRQAENSIDRRFSSAVGKKADKADIEDRKLYSEQE